MASGTFKWFGDVPRAIFNKEVDLVDDDIRVSLHTNVTAPDQDNHNFWNDLSATEIAGSGTYAANGTALANKTFTYTSGTNTWKFDADDVTWTSVTATFRYAVLYDRTPASDATRNLIGYIDFGSDQTVTGGTINLTWDAAGIGTVVVA